MELLDTFFKPWSGLPRTEFLPRLSTYLDRANVKLQPFTIIVDIEAETMPIRLFGTAMAELSGRDFTGWNYLDSMIPEHRKPALERDRLCAVQPCGLRIGMSIVAPHNKHRTLEVLVLPVLRSGGVSLVRVSAILPEPKISEVPIAVEKSDSAAWVDLGRGIPLRAPDANMLCV